MPDVNQGQVASVAWEYLMTDGPVDQIFTSQALLYLLKDGGYMEYAEGGRLFEVSVEYAENVTFRSVGEMETLDTSRIDVYDSARYEQKIFAGTVVFSDLEVLRNAVANRKFDVVKKKLKNGVNSAMQQLNRMLHSDGTGNGGKDMDGQAKIISVTPNVGTVGGINAQTWAFWRNRQASGQKNLNPFDNLRAAMESVHNQCSLGGTEKRPTGVYSDRATFEGYKSTLTQVLRLVKDSDGDPDADIGFLNDAIAFQGIPYVYDEDAPAGEARFVNKNYEKLCVLKGAWLKMKDPVEPANQLARVHRVMTVGNLTAEARRHLGVVSGIN